jgi:GT2 family glycosyltransferase
LARRTSRLGARLVSAARTGVDAPHVVAIIVNYRTPKLTLGCVESLLRSERVQPRIIVIDNDSHDDSVTLLRAALRDVPNVTVHARAINDGYAGGNNAGLAIANELGARFALILNSDTVVAPDCLRLLVDELESDAHVALVCPRIFYGDTPELLWFGGGTFSPWRGRPVHVGLLRTAHHGWCERRDLSFATGCALLMRLAACEPPVFDPSLFAYAEDLDLSLRLRKKGHRIRYVPEAIVWHYEGSSHRAAGGQSLRFYLGTRNLLWVVSRHAQWYHWPMLAPMLVMNVVGRFCIVALRDRDVGALAGVLRGAWHAVVGGRHAIERGFTPSSR